jgi:pilus assembly protein CpaB
MSDAPRPVRHWNLPVLVFGAVLTIAGFAASVAIGRSSQTPSAAATGPLLVASRDLDQRTTLVASDVQIIRISVADLPPAALTSPNQAAGQVLQVPLKKGQPLFANLVGASTDVVGTQPALLPLPEGLVADTLPNAELVGVAGYIRPGDYIDLLAVVTPRSGGSANVRTVYSGVHVVRVGSASDQAAAQASGAVGPTTSITVAVTECQAEFLNWFLANANLKYTLLSSKDYAAAAAAAPDTACPAAGTKGVGQADVQARWPGLTG